MIWRDLTWRLEIVSVSFQLIKRGRKVLFLQRENILVQIFADHKFLCDNSLTLVIFLLLNSESSKDRNRFNLKIRNYAIKTNMSRRQFLVHRLIATTVSCARCIETSSLFFIKKLIHRSKSNFLFRRTSVKRDEFSCQSRPSTLHSLQKKFLMKARKLKGKTRARETNFDDLFSRYGSSRVDGSMTQNACSSSHTRSSREKFYLWEFTANISRLLDDWSVIFDYFLPRSMKLPKVNYF